MEPGHLRDLATRLRRAVILIRSHSITQDQQRLDEFLPFITLTADPAVACGAMPSTLHQAHPEQPRAIVLRMIREACIGLWGYPQMTADEQAVIDRLVGTLEAVGLLGFKAFNVVGTLAGGFKLVRSAPPEPAKKAKP
jgi:hypothetical protein